VESQLIAVEGDHPLAKLLEKMVGGRKPKHVKPEFERVPDNELFGFLMHLYDQERSLPIRLALAKCCVCGVPVDPHKQTCSVCNYFTSLPAMDERDLVLKEFEGKRLEPETPDDEGCNCPACQLRDKMRNGEPFDEADKALLTELMSQGPPFRLDEDEDERE